MSEELRIRIVPAIDDIVEPAWDGCANPTESSAASLPYNPFISHAFLSALEASGSVTARIGYGFWRAWHAWQTTAGGSSWLERAGVADSLAAGGVVLGYYLAYFAGLRWKLALHRRGR